MCFRTCNFAEGYNLLLREPSETPPPKTKNHKPNQTKQKTKKSHKESFLG